jgi:Domain of unknown function (DUF4190)
MNEVFMSEQQIPRERASGALPSMVCGIVGVATCWLAISGLILGIIAIVFSVKANRRIKENSELEGKGMAIAGLVCGIVATVFGFFYLLYYLFWGALFSAIFAGSGLLR